MHQASWIYLHFNVNQVFPVTLMDGSRCISGCCSKNPCCYDDLHWSPLCWPLRRWTYTWFSQVGVNCLCASHRILMHFHTVEVNNKTNPNIKQNMTRCCLDILLCLGGKGFSAGATVCKEHRTALLGYRTWQNMALLHGYVWNMVISTAHTSYFNSSHLLILNFNPVLFGNCNCVGF